MIFSIQRDIRPVIQYTAGYPVSVRISNSVSGGIYGQFSICGLISGFRSDIKFSIRGIYYQLFNTRPDIQPDIQFPFGYQIHYPGGYTASYSKYGQISGFRSDIKFRIRLTGYPVSGQFNIRFPVLLNSHNFPHVASYHWAMEKPRHLDQVWGHVSLEPAFPSFTHWLTHSHTTWRFFLYAVYHTKNSRMINFSYKVRLSYQRHFFYLPWLSILFNNVYVY